jgi:hypothetical protein
VVTLSDLGERITTPYQEQLNRGGQYEIGRTLTGFYERRAGIRRRIEQLVRTRTGEEHHVVECEAALDRARATLTPAELEPRSHQERELGPNALRARRMQVREQRINEAQDRLDVARRKVVERTAEIDEQYQLIDEEFVGSQERARSIAIYTVVRISAYWDAVTQFHPEGRHLASMLPLIEPVLPDWLSARCVRGAISQPPPGDPDAAPPPEPPDRANAHENTSESAEGSGPAEGPEPGDSDQGRVRN